jgi:hypothetical protein
MHTTSHARTSGLVAVMGMLLSGLVLLVPSCTTAPLIDEPSYLAYEEDRGYDLPPKLAEVPDSPQNRDLRFLYDLVVQAYPFIPVMERTNSNWFTRAQERLGRDYSSYSLHSDAYFNTLQGLLNGLEGHIEIVNHSFYAMLHNPDFDNTQSTNAYVRAMSFDPEGPYRIALRNHDDAETKPKHAIYLLMENRAEYLYVQIGSFSMNDNQLLESAKRLSTLFKENSTPDMPIIIDVRGNGGGRIEVWQWGIVYPLTAKPLAWEGTLLFRDYPLLHDWAEFFKQTLLPISDFKGRLTHPEDLDYFSYYNTISLDVPASDTPVLHGGIYIIQDKWGFSATDWFLTFAKSTGFATLVGSENSAGDGILKAPTVVRLPESG